MTTENISTAPTPTSDSSGRVIAIGGGWLGLALLANASGLFAQLVPPFPQLVLVSLTAFLLVGFWKLAPFRQWALTVNPRVLVAIHLVRFIGIYFLVLHAQGELPVAFAVPAGWGDIAVATTAVGVLLVSPGRVGGRRVWLAWNTLGLADILFVVATAARIALADPVAMAALMRLPLGLLPTFVVPIIIASHVILFARLSRKPIEP